MKATIYIFGNFANGYSQYPIDYTRDLFEEISKTRKGATELIYHRAGKLTYYIYTREMSHTAKTFIGLCYVFNDILITDFSQLFNIFEDTITNIVVKGELLEFTDDGNLSTKVSQLYTNTDELQRISDYLNTQLSSVSKYTEKLPPQNYAVSSSDWKNFTIDDEVAIKSAIKNYSNIRVIKGENYNTDSLNSYAYKLKTKTKELKTLNNEISKLHDQISTLKRQKKQISWVIFLLILIILGGFVFYTYAQDKRQIIQTKSEIIQKQDATIEKQKEYITTLKNDSAILERSLTTKTRQLDITKQKLNDLYNELNNIDEKIYFPSWRSTNHTPKSSSSKEYTFYANKGDKLNIPYYVSSEKGYDNLTITLDYNGKKEQILKESGKYSNVREYTFTYSGTYRMEVKYTKDGSNDYYGDYAEIKRFYIYRPIIDRLRQIATYNE